MRELVLQLGLCAFALCTAMRNRQSTMLASVIDATKRKSSDCRLMLVVVAIATVGAVINANPSSMNRAGCMRPSGSVVAAVSSATVSHYCGERECGVGDGIARVQHAEIEPSR